MKNKKQIIVEDKKPKEYRFDINVFNSKILMDQFENDLDFVIDLIQSFIKEISPKMIVIKDFVSNFNQIKLNDLAHGMKGASQSLRCPKISKLFHQMQLCDNKTNAIELLAEIESNWIILNNEFDHFMSKYD